MQTGICRKQQIRFDKPSILERLKQEKARQLAPEQTGTPKPKKNHEQEL